MTVIFKDIASQRIPLGNLVKRTDGSRLLTGASVRVSKDDTWATGGGTLALEETDQWYYIPTKAETKCAKLVIAADHTDAVNKLQFAARPKLGPVEFINYSGDDDTSGADLLAAWNSMPAPGYVKISAGKFAIGDNKLTQNAGVKIIGSGKDTTWVTSSFYRSPIEAKVRLDSRCRFQDFTLESISTPDGSYEFPFGMDGSNLAAVSDVALKGIRIVGHTDCLSNSSGMAITVRLDDCDLESAYDGIACSLQNTASRLWMKDVRFFIDEATPDGISSGFGFAGRTIGDRVRIIMRARTAGGTTNTMVGFYCNPGARVTLTNSLVHLIGAATTVNYAISSGGVTSMINSEWDRSLVLLSGSGSVRDRNSPLRPTTEPTTYDPSSIPTAAQNAAAAADLAIAAHNTEGTAGEAWNASRALAYGKRVFDANAHTETLYAPDGTTIAKVFAIAPNLTSPISRTPQ